MRESPQLRYTTRNRLLRWPLSLVDRLLQMIFGTPQPPETRVHPLGILVCMQAHIGDAVLATAVIPALRRTWPEARIGFLVNPLAAEVVRHHPDVAAVHTVEHWYLNRSTPLLPLRLLRHWRSSRQALASIRSQHYDLAIDLYHYFPNSLPLLWRSGIRQRIGWASGGFGPLRTDAPDEIGLATHVLERHRRLLATMDPRAGELPLRPDLPLTDETRQRWRALMQGAGLRPPFVALHVGAHGDYKRWPTGHWSALASRLVGEGHSVVLFGHGDADQVVCQAIEVACPAVINLCNHLDWQQLVAAIESCTALVAHDSAAIHIANAFNRPSVCVAAGISNLSIWLQSLPHSRVLMKPVPCAPCGRPRGCTSMECIRGVTVQQVATAVDFVGADACSGDGMTRTTRDIAESVRSPLP